MASVHYSTTRRRWCVQWVDLAGTRKRRTFHTQSEADAFVPTITNERHGRPGPRYGGGRTTVEWTPQFVQNKVRRSVDIDDNGCWVWRPRGGTNRYAQVVRRVPGGKKSVLMHRASYEAFVGPIPEGLELDHLCATTRCVNPEHLEPVTTAENIRRRDERKTSA